MLVSAHKFESVKKVLFARKPLFVAGFAFFPDDYGFFPKNVILHRFLAQ
jgi:hypothetical protein